MANKDTWQTAKANATRIGITNLKEYFKLNWVGVLDKADSAHKTWNTLAAQSGKDPAAIAAQQAKLRPLKDTALTELKRALDIGQQYGTIAEARKNILIKADVPTHAQAYDALMTAVMKVKHDLIQKAKEIQTRA